MSLGRRVVHAVTERVKQHLELDRNNFRLINDPAFLVWT